jgi:fibronectin type 3 domain-containing protein
VYRSTVSGGSFTQIASGVLPTSYLDCTVSAEQTYFFVVTAVDASANESVNSNQASIALPFFDSIHATMPFSTAQAETLASAFGASAQAHIHISRTDAIATIAVLTTSFSGPDPMTENIDENISGSFTGSDGGRAAYSVAPADLFSVRDSISLGSGIAAPISLTVVSTVFPPRAQLVWRHSPSSRVIGQNVRRSFFPDGPFNVIASVSSTAQYFTDLSINPGAQYYYSVTALSPSAESVLSNKAQTLVPSNVAPPSSLIVTVRQGKPVLIWRHSPTRGLTSERVLRATQSGGPYFLLAQIPTIAQTFTDASAVAGATYFYVVTDVCGDLESVFSREVTLTVPSAP